MDEKEWLDKEEIAGMLGKNEKTVLGLAQTHNWKSQMGERHGRVPARKLFSAADVRAYQALERPAIEANGGEPPVAKAAVESRPPKNFLSSEPINNLIARIAIALQTPPQNTPALEVSKNGEDPNYVFVAVRRGIFIRGLSSSQLKILCRRRLLDHFATGQLSDPSYMVRPIDVDRMMKLGGLESAKTEEQYPNWLGKD